MKINQLIEAADRAYGSDGVLGQCWNFKKQEPRSWRIRLRVGDGLASFIVVELAETFNPKATGEAQIEEAIRVMESAIRQVQGVVDAFDHLPEEIDNV